VKLELAANLSEPFRQRVQGVAEIADRSEILLEQIAAPKDIAEEAIAISATVIHADHSDADRGVGRLVICRDSNFPEGWNSEYRIILYAKSPVETDMGKDPVVDELPWNWLMDSLAARNASFHSEAGTTTRILSTGHGALTAQPQHAEIEIRSSWAPDGEDFTPHVQAFEDLLALISGLPPSDEKVVRL
jgi:hypothetical protein